MTALYLSIIPLTASEGSEPEPLASISKAEMANCCFANPEYMLPTIYYDCPSMNCAPCWPVCHHFYLGVEGGWAIGLGYADRVSFVNANNNGVAYDAYPSSGCHVGANLGYRWNRLLRTDLSYTYLRPGSYKWKSDFFPISSAVNPTFNIRYKGNLHSHLVLFNTYLHLNAICCFLPCLDPYLTAGVGVAINHLGPTKEIFQSVTVSTTSAFTQTNFGARVGIGAMKYFCRCWIADFGFNANYIGRVGTDDTRTLTNGTTQFIGPFHFENNWIGIFYLGVKRTF